MTLVASRRPDAATCVRDGRETYVDTGRRVGERLGSHVVLWIVDDPAAWAAAIEARAGFGSMVCGYCDEAVAWPEAILGHARLTGYHLLGVHRETGELVVLAEATTHSGETTVLPHHCTKIPDEVRAAALEERLGDRS